MLFGPLAGQDSLRGIEAGLATQSQSLYHLGMKPIHRSTLSDANEHRYSDHILELKGFYSQKQFPHRRRRIRSKDPETGTIIVLLTHHFTGSAKTIAPIYKDRWPIELPFQSIQQPLKVKSFIGTSP